ncbi:MAG: hypothetical protein GY795_35540, partial [Desulfobacterales bacterium]|nr:hypothetical protein [Desulfobacterales bacterium]
MTERKLTSDRQQRWRNRFLGQPIDIEYRAGRNHIVPDILSRQPPPNSAPAATDTPLDEDQYDQLYMLTAQEEKEISWVYQAAKGINDVKEEALKQMQQNQRKDPFIVAIETHAITGKLDDSSEYYCWVKKFAPNLEYMRGILYYQTGRRYADMALVIPQQLKEGVLRDAHTELLGGHFSIQKTFQRVAGKFW